MHTDVTNVSIAAADSAVLQVRIRLESREVRSQNGDPKQMWTTVLRFGEGRIID